jgi:hypothetical protein
MLSTTTKYIYKRWLDDNNDEEKNYYKYRVDFQIILILYKINLKIYYYNFKFKIESSL